jgi:predicted  nucleic acid-binding Zn-ribbon protein
MHAFRCKNCGHLHPAEHAGESDLPHGCVVCGAGVMFSPRGVKSLDADNWEVLADATPERLEELGLAPEEVARHEGGKPSPEKEGPGGQHVAREAGDGSNVKDQI